jgi:hypothetical protein
MSDTTSHVASLVTAHHARMSPTERLCAASAMFDVATAIIDSSLPAHLSPRERRLARALRLYGDELPTAALEAYADYVTANAN